MARINVYGVSRDLWEHPMFADEPYTEKQAWAWLIGAAAWKAIQTRGNAGKVSLRRGEFSFAVRFLADKWQWSKSRVDRFLERLQNEDMLRDTSRDGSKIYSVSNYNDYQKVGVPNGTTDGTLSGTPAGRQRDKEETGETGKHNLATLGNALVAWCSLASDFPPWWPFPEWAAFMGVRKKLRAPLTSQSVKNLIRDVSKLREAGNDPAAVFDQSVTRAWRGVFATSRAPPTRQRQGGLPPAKILSILDKPTDEPCH